MYQLEGSYQLVVLVWTRWNSYTVAADALILRLQRLSTLFFGS